MALERPIGIGKTPLLSSTLHWGSTTCSYGTASARVVGKYYPYGQEKGSGNPATGEKFTGYFRDLETGFDYADQRYHNPGTGRFLTPEIGVPAAADLTDPGSWNRYAYVGDDPIGFNDPLGTNKVYPPQDPNQFCNFSPGLGPEGGTVPIYTCSSLPYGGPSPIASDRDCNPTGNTTTQTKINFVEANWAAATAAAMSIQSDLGTSINIANVATAFLQWSAWESGYGQNAGSQAENNMFGQQQPGSWGGTSTTCPANLATTNSCFPTSVTWGQELANALGATSGKTGVTYLNALEASLASNPGEGRAAMLQSIANNGWNPSSNYGSTIAAGINIFSVISCLQANGII